MQNDRMTKLFMVLGFLVVAAMLMPVLIEWATGLLSHGFVEVGRSVQEILDGATRTRGSARVQGIIRLALYLAAGMVIAKLIFKRRG